MKRGQYFAIATVIIVMAIVSGVFYFSSAISAQRQSQNPPRKNMVDVLREAEYGMASSFENTLKGKSYRAVSQINTILNDTEENLTTYAARQGYTLSISYSHTNVSRVHGLDASISISEASDSLSATLNHTYVRMVWWNSSWDYRVQVNVSSGDYARENDPVEVMIDYQTMLHSLGGGVLDNTSIRVVEYNEDGSVDTEKDGQYDNGSTGKTIWILDGSTSADTERIYYVYFDDNSGGEKGSAGYSTTWGEISEGSDYVNNSKVYFALGIATVNTYGGITDCIVHSSSTNQCEGAVHAAARLDAATEDVDTVSITSLVDGGVAKKFTITYAGSSISGNGNWSEAWLYRYNYYIKGKQNQTSSTTVFGDLGTAGGDISNSTEDTMVMNQSSMNSWEYAYVTDNGNSEGYFRMVKTDVVWTTTAAENKYGWDLTEQASAEGGRNTVVGLLDSDVTPSTYIARIAKPPTAVVYGAEGD
jgi:hypothetical protein